MACFPSGEARLYGFRRQRRHKKWRPKGRRTSPAQRYYITPEGESPQPVREASAGPGQNPWRPGPKARRRHQPSPAKAGVNLREYWKAPPRSRPRPRCRRLNPHAHQGVSTFGNTASRVNLPSFYQSQHPVPLCGKDAFFFFQRCRELIHFPVPSISIRLQGIHGEIFIFIENGQVIFPTDFLHV